MTHWSDDPRSQTRFRWTRPDGSLDVLAMCRQLDADYAARFRTGAPRTESEAR